VAGGSIRVIRKRCYQCAVTVLNRPLAVGARAAASGALVLGVLALGALSITIAGSTAAAEPPSSGIRAAVSELAHPYAQRQAVVANLPLDRLTPPAQQRILSIAGSPTIYRRLPTQAIKCDRDMFLLLTRNPEILVGMWDLMGITKVACKRTGPYQLEAEDGTGTQCRVDLVYGDQHTHIFVTDGSYDGALVAKPIRGQAVFVLNSSYAQSSDGGTTVTGSLDCFIQFDSLGADLLARTLSGLIGRSADNNFLETARFIAQVSQAAEKNSGALIDVAQRIPQVSPATRRTFVDVIATVARRHENNPRTAARPQGPR
jgi:hypothetical protein